MKIRWTRLQNIIIGLLCLWGRWLLMDRLFLYLGICIWIKASKHSATWHVSGCIPMCCVSRQEAGNVMMVPVISVASSQFKMKSTLFSCALACKCVRWGFNLQTCFTAISFRTLWTIFWPDSRAGGGAPEMGSRLSTLATCGFGVRNSLEATTG